MRCSTAEKKGVGGLYLEGEEVSCRPFFPLVNSTCCCSLALNVPLKVHH
jgi:hypothetical protein